MTSSSGFYNNDVKASFCWTFTKKGYCNKGDACPWVHPSPEMYAASEGAEQLCRGWVMYGTCQRGQWCRWAHPVNQVPVYVPIEMIHPSPQNQQETPRPMLMPPWVAQVCGGTGEFTPLGHQDFRPAFIEDEQFLGENVDNQEYSKQDNTQEGQQYIQDDTACDIDGKLPSARSNTSGDCSTDCDAA